MKRFYLALVALICTQSMLSAHFNENVQICENAQGIDAIKVYVNPDAIKLSEDGIYIEIGDGSKLPLTNIQSNGRGVFTTFSPSDSLEE